MGGERQNRPLVESRGIGVIQLRSLRLRKTAPGASRWFPKEAAGVLLSGGSSPWCREARGQWWADSTVKCPRAATAPREPRREGAGSQ